jgi:phosphoadenosine phosphosulfate reductase
MLQKLHNDAPDAGLDKSLPALELRLKAAQARAAIAEARAIFADRIALVSSFGADSIVLLHLAAAVDSAIPVLFIDTDRHFPETLRYVDEVALLLGLKDLRRVRPFAATIAARDPRAERAGYDPDGCCDIRKTQPLDAALKDFDAWISGRKRFQAQTRAELALAEADGARVKINPMLDWSNAHIRAYRQTYGLPQHPLVAKNYPSIGCAPCTSRVDAGEDARSGRWRGFDKTECGIHFINSGAGI